MCFYEPHECSNCWHVGQLNAHGRCERCDSAQVMSLALMELLIAQKTERAAVAMGVA